MNQNLKPKPSGHINKTNFEWKMSQRPFRLKFSHYLFPYFSLFVCYFTILKYQPTKLPLLKVQLVKACNEGNFVVNAQKKRAQCGHLFAHNSAKLEITSDNGFAEKLEMPLK